MAGRLPCDRWRVTALYRITGHYPMAVSVGRAAEQEAISKGSWSPWLVDADVPAARADDDVATKGDDR
jgi:hypothetical protein